MKEQQRAILNQKLVALLGFEDGADDVLSHLLTIEENAVRLEKESCCVYYLMCAVSLTHQLHYSHQDLLDYLTQLLGMDHLEATRSFVRDVDRARRGESISSSGSNTAKSPKQSSANDNNAPGATKAPDQQQSNVGSAKSKKDDIQTSSTMKNQKNSVAASKQQPSKKSPSQPAVAEMKPVPPQKGKAKFDCGCFGSFHKALTNCLYCGRIACQREGYGFCPFCGYLVEEVKPTGDDADDDEAWKHKERLLRYDREFAQRTVILDDQADYFNREMSMWSTEEERAAAARQEQERHDDIQKRKMQMNLGL